MARQRLDIADANGDRDRKSTSDGEKADLPVWVRTVSAKIRQQSRIERMRCRLAGTMVDNDMTAAIANATQAVKKATLEPDSCRMCHCMCQLSRGQLEDN